MTPSELAAKLEQGGIFRITPEEEALRNKCVRFAADMEKLTSRGCNPSLEDVYDNSDDPGDPEKYSVRWWDGRLWQISYGVDYYAAARKAVEALEEKRCI